MTDPTPDSDAPVAFFSPDPPPEPTHITNMTPDLPQPIVDHNELIAQKEAAARAYLEERAAEYAEWEAAEDILTPDGLPIYRQGMRIPISNVKLHGYDKTGQAQRVKK